MLMLISGSGAGDGAAKSTEERIAIATARGAMNCNLIKSGCLRCLSECRLIG
jgi:hypothetical protein